MESPPENTVSKPKTKTFKVKEQFHLEKVDSWWAKQLRTGPKEIVNVTWVAEGNLSWTLSLMWQPVAADYNLAIGMPEYANISTEVMELMLTDSLEEFDDCLREFNLLEERVKLWKIEEFKEDVEGSPKKQSALRMRDDLDDLDVYIAAEYLWPRYLMVRKDLRGFITFIQELRAELEARQSSDFFMVEVDRGMLRESFSNQLGYDNMWLFDDNNDAFLE